MTRSYPHDRYAKLIQSTLDELIKLGELKGGEYAGDVDRLANFRRNGENLGLPMESVWAVYAGKHWDAIMQYIKDERNGVKRERLEGIEGRVHDLMVYSLLLLAMLDERKNYDPAAKDFVVRPEGQLEPNWDVIQGDTFEVGSVVYHRPKDRMALTLKDVAIPRQTILPDAEERN